jgi:SOS response regulatory protein OraA/RecX
LTDAGRPPEALLDEALHLLAPRIRGIQELRGRLLKRGFPPDQVASCLTWLEERGLLDDETFSVALARERLRLSPRSPNVVRKELTRRGISPVVADRALARVLEEEGIQELDLAKEAARAWVRKQSPRVLQELLGDRFTPRRERARRRLYGFLVRRGFRGEATREGMDTGETEARKLLMGRS